MIMRRFVHSFDLPIAEGVKEEEENADEQHANHYLELKTDLMVGRLFVMTMVSLYQLLHLLYLRQRQTGNLLLDPR